MVARTGKLIIIPKTAVVSRWSVMRQFEISLPPRLGESVGKNQSLWFSRDLCASVVNVFRNNFNHRVKHAPGRTTEHEKL
jgi:hypothetical protein